MQFNGKCYLEKKIKQTKENVIVVTSSNDRKAAVVEEMENPSKGRKIPYMASEEISPTSITSVLGKAIGNPN